VLSLSKHERTLQPFQPLPFDRLPSTSSGQAGRTDWKGVLRHPTFAKLRTEQGERTGKSIIFGASRAAGKSVPYFISPAQREQRCACPSLFFSTDSLQWFFQFRWRVAGFTPAGAARMIFRPK
jgi:hypothetical protein